MANNVQIQKTVFNSDEFNKVINRDFSTFTQPVPEEDTDTVENLFRLYENNKKTRDSGGVLKPPRVESFAMIPLFNGGQMFQTNDNL